MLMTLCNYIVISTIVIVIFNFQLPHPLNRRPQLLLSILLLMGVPPIHRESRVKGLFQFLCILRFAAKSGGHYVELQRRNTCPRLREIPTAGTQRCSQLHPIFLLHPIEKVRKFSPIHLG